MQFHEKLDLLLNLTQTSNRTLAHELQVDPSLISRLRTGTRGLPRNREHLKNMSVYFAKKCATEYQRHALFEVIGINSSLTVKRDQLSEVLYYWFCGDTAETEELIKTFDSFELEIANPGPSSGAAIPTSGNVLYYGNEGKRAAARAVCQYLFSLPGPETVYILADESDDWIAEDFAFSETLRSLAMHLLRRNFKFCRIAPPSGSIDQAFDSMSRWLPLYMYGQIDSYYYPHFRDNVYRRTLVVVPGKIAVMSSSIANRHSAGATILTTDPRLTQACWGEFHDFFSLCLPVHNVLTAASKLLPCFTQFLSVNGPRIQKLTSLSTETAPHELIHYCMEKNLLPDAEKLFRLYHQEINLVKKEQYEFIDICPLATAKDVRTERVPIMLSVGGKTPPLFYTPETYVLHLKSILNLLETCRNYHFVPLQKITRTDGNLMVKENQKALLIRQPSPFTVFEICPPESVELCREYLMRIANRIGYTGQNRKKIILQIKQLIQELQD